MTNKNYFLLTKIKKTNFLKLKNFW